jgi:rhodanese-related sulfurtransferase
MSSVTTISVDNLTRLIGTPSGPAVVDVRTDEDFATDPRLIPATRRPFASVTDWAGEIRSPTAVIVCQRGRKLSEGVAAWLRHQDVPAEALAGGFEAWAKAGLTLVPQAKLPARDRLGRTV